MKERKGVVTVVSQVASAHAPKGMEVEVRNAKRKSLYDVFVGDEKIASSLSSDEAVVCAFAAGSVFAVLAKKHASRGRSRRMKKSS